MCVNINEYIYIYIYIEKAYTEKATCQYICDQAYKNVSIKRQLYIIPECQNHYIKVSERIYTYLSLKKYKSVHI